MIRERLDIEGAQRIARAHRTAPTYIDLFVADLLRRVGRRLQLAPACAVIHEAAHDRARFIQLCHQLGLALAPRFDSSNLHGSRGYEYPRHPPRSRALKRLLKPPPPSTTVRPVLAGLAQLVERKLPKLEVTSSSLVSRSRNHAGFVCGGARAGEVTADGLLPLGPVRLEPSHEQASFRCSGGFSGWLRGGRGERSARCPQGVRAASGDAHGVGVQLPIRRRGATQRSCEPTGRRQMGADNSYLSLASRPQ
jgi:hypothetical protein